MPNRDIVHHIIEGTDKPPHVTVQAVDDPGPGGAFHKYELGFSEHPTGAFMSFQFQKGPIQEFGQNGVTNEALLAIVVHRLECFQAGAFSCAENAEALGLVQDGLTALKRRTKSRLLRGVEGQNKP